MNGYIPDRTGSDRTCQNLVTPHGYTTYGHVGYAIHRYSTWLRQIWLRHIVTPPRPIIDTGACIYKAHTPHRYVSIQLIPYYSRFSHLVPMVQGGNVTSAGWQVTLCDPMWHVSSRSGVATLRTAIHLLRVTYGD